MVRKIKSVNPSSNVCGVGYFATYAYKKILEECQEIDYIIMGEFEEPVLSMVRDFEAGKEIKYSEYLYCIVSQKDASNKKINRLDLKNYPKVLDRILLNKNKKIRIASVEGSRGCIGNCTFCAMNYRDDIKDVNWTGRDIKDRYKYKRKGKKYEKKVKKAGCTENESYVIFFQRMQPVRYFY